MALVLAGSASWRGRFRLVRSGFPKLPTLLPAWAGVFGPSCRLVEWKIRRYSYHVKRCYEDIRRLGQKKSPRGRGGWWRSGGKEKAREGRAEGSYSIGRFGLVRFVRQGFEGAAFFALFDDVYQECLYGLSSHPSWDISILGLAHHVFRELCYYVVFSKPRSK